MNFLEQVAIIALAIPFLISIVLSAINLQLALSRTRYNKYLVLLLGPAALLIPHFFDEEGNRYRKRAVYSWFACMSIGALTWAFFLTRAES